MFSQALSTILELLTYMANYTRRRVGFLDLCHKRSRKVDNLHRQDCSVLMLRFLQFLQGRSNHLKEKTTCIVMHACTVCVLTPAYTIKVIIKIIKEKKKVSIHNKT